MARSVFVFVVVGVFVWPKASSGKFFVDSGVVLSVWASFKFIRQESAARRGDICIVVTRRLASTACKQPIVFAAAAGFVVRAFLRLESSARASLSGAKRRAFARSLPAARSKAAKFDLT